MTPSQNLPNLIRLNQNGQHISDNDDLRLLGDIRVRRLVAHHDDCHGYDVRKTRQSLLFSEERFRIPNAGCIPLLRKRAARLGKALSVQCVPPIRRLPEPTSREILGYPGLANFAFHHERGSFGIPQGFDATIIIYELAVAYPHQNIIALGNQVGTLEKIAAQLKERFEAERRDLIVEVAHGRGPLNLDVDDNRPRIICSTFTEAANLDFATSDIVILLDARNCIHAQAQAALETMDAQFRLFGIVRRGQSLSPYEEGVMMGVFGPELIDLMAYRYTRRDVRVAWVNNRQHPIELERHGSDFDYRCVIHNERRNRLIARLAKALAVRDPGPCRDYRAIFDWCDWYERGRLNVTVLVDRLDHALALHTKLPTWPIIARENISLQGYSKRVRRLFRPRGPSWDFRRWQIVMTDAAEDFHGYSSDIVIWAGAGPCAAPLPNSWLAESSHYRRPLLIVDFHDAFNPKTGQWSRRRMDEYAHRDFFPVGVHPTDGRIRRFLDFQQRGKR